MDLQFEMLSASAIKSILFALCPMQMEACIGQLYKVVTRVVSAGEALTTIYYG
jgi:hypothetical protein